MQLLSDFPTLAEAQTYEVITYKEITAGKSSQFFGLSGMLDLLEANSTDVTPLVLSDTMSTTVGALCRTILNSAKTSGFASDPSTEDGATNRGASQVLVTAGVFTQSLVDAFWKMSEVVTTPYATVTQEDFDEAHDVGETITLPANTGQHKVALTITTAPRKLTKLTIQQRFGNTAEDLTEWHDVASVSVLYKQSTYSSGMIPASGSLIRELRLVSPLTLGVSIV